MIRLTHPQTKDATEVPVVDHGLNKLSLVAAGWRPCLALLEKGKCNTQQDYNNVECELSHLLCCGE